MELIGRFFTTPSFVGLLMFALFVVLIAAGAGASARRTLEAWQGAPSVVNLLLNAMVTAGFIAAILVAGRRMIAPSYVPLAAGLAAAVALIVALVPGLTGALLSQYSGNIAIGGVFFVVGLALTGTLLARRAPTGALVMAGAFVLIGGLAVGDVLRRMMRGD